MISIMFGTAWLLFLTSLLTFAHAQNEYSSCDDFFVTIRNQSDVDFYQKCTNITASVFGIGHEFQGAFNMPGVQSVAEFIVGYLGPKVRASTRVDDGVTTVSMADLKTVTGRGVLFGYLDNLTSVSFPKLETVNGDFVVVGSLGLRNLSLPAVSSLTGAIDLAGDFDQYVTFHHLSNTPNLLGRKNYWLTCTSVDLPSLKSLSYLRIQTTGRINCPALGARYSNLSFHPQSLDLYSGFICTTFNLTNRWNSSDLQNNPTVEQAAAALNGTSSDTGSSTKTGDASIQRVGSTIILTIFALAMFVWL